MCGDAGETSRMCAGFSFVGGVFMVSLCILGSMALQLAACDPQDAR
jgi:hypothetical protein